MSASAALAFNSVKLPGAFVREAKHAAIAMRRSTAGQIEYWAMLGKAVEEGGLTVREAAQALVVRVAAPEQNSALKAEPGRSAQTWLEDYEQFAASGDLVDRVRQVITQNAAQQNTLATQTAH